jgi:protein tyrosine phosphatase type 4A
MAFSGLKYKRPEHSEIKYKNMRFLITDRPNDGTVNKYIDELNKYGADVVVRVCDPSYSKDTFEDSGIKVIVSVCE